MPHIFLSTLLMPNAERLIIKSIGRENRLDELYKLPIIYSPYNAKEEILLSINEGITFEEELFLLSDSNKVVQLFNYESNTPNQIAERLIQYCQRFDISPSNFRSTLFVGRLFFKDKYFAVTLERLGEKIHFMTNHLRNGKW